MDLPAPPRTNDEVTFYVNEIECERCGKRGLVDERPSFTRGSYTGKCASCGFAREFRFAGLPARGSSPAWNLSPDATPTRLFDAEQLRAIAERELANVPVEPRALRTVAMYDVARRHLVRGRTAWIERAKFHPTDPAVVARLAELEKLWDDYLAAKDDVASHPGALEKPIGLDGRFSQHMDWVRRGRRGDGQLVFRNESWDGIKLGSTFHHALVEDSKFERIDFSYANFHAAQVRRASFLACNFSRSEMKEAAFEDVTMKGSAFTFGDFSAVVARRGDWREIRASRSTWRAEVTEIDLRNAVLCDAIIEDCAFVKCDLRGADLSHPEATLDVLGRIRRTKFVDCDLRGVILTGTRLDAVTFERCNLQGIVGSLGEANIIDPILDPEAVLAEDPFDDGRWLVYEDWLLEQEDPRSALIRAEKAGDSKAAKKALVVLKYFGKQWRSMSTCLKGSTWRAGLLVDVEFDTASTALFKTLLSSPAARMMRSLRLKFATVEETRLALDHLRNAHRSTLREIHVEQPGSWIFAALARDTPLVKRLRRLRVDRSDVLDQVRMLMDESL